MTNQPKYTRRYPLGKAKSVLQHKVCPKCGSDNLLVNQDDDNPTFSTFISCGNCEFFGDADDSYMGALRYWDEAARKAA